MRSNDPRLARHVVDGQALLVPSDEAFEDLLEDGSLDGRPVGVGRILSQYRQLALTVPGLLVALGADPTPDKPWWVYLLVRVEGELHRVHIERQKHGCGWEGVTGNHRVMAVYLGTDDALARMQAHWDAPLVACPRCGEALDKPAIWTA